MTLSRAIFSAIISIQLIFADSTPLKAQDTQTLREAAGLRDAALQGSPAYAILESLTTEVGPRLAGTEAEKRARDWALRHMAKLGFTNGNIETFDMPTWVRGLETGSIISPFPQQVYLSALGNSASTGANGLEAPVVIFKTLDDLKAAPPASLKGKIAYVGHNMQKTQDGAHYGYFGGARFVGPKIASEKGAAGIIIRSVGTDSRRFPHTGNTNFAETTAIPAAALSNPDADQIERIAATGADIRFKMTLTPKQIGTTKSGNVIFDIKGSEHPDEIVILGGHLDSWDLGTGAVDDGAGVAVGAAVLKMIADSGLRPKRTIRLVMWGAEEVGLKGARAYAEAHADEIDKHILGSESDFGADKIFKLLADVGPDGQKVVEQMLRLMRPLGISYQNVKTSSGPDLSPLNAAGLPAFRLAQDGTDYFDLHHTPDDTIDKVSPHKLDQNVAAYLVFVWLAANSDANFRQP